jgi:uncharacterized protein YggU (UPF0235/DUF167 family)
VDVIDLTIRLTPRAARETVDPRPDGVLAVRMTAPPIDGRASDGADPARRTPLAASFSRSRRSSS